jgi:alpha-mannosidase
MDKITAHIISHSHWDREWYMPYEKHHVRLVKLMDNILELFDKDPEFKSFHLDGQTIVLEDYLQIRPEMQEKIVKYIKEGRLRVGPWYILQDEFLTSSESNIRNLLIGMRDAKRFGAVTMVGYFPDAFGNIGQAPQILKQAGMKGIIFGRGVKPVGFDNKVEEFDKYESPFSEMLWQSPDGSSMLGILFANWYHNGMEVPIDEKEAEVYWTERLKNVERFAATNQYLFMNGCDHQPVQMDLSSALNTARKLYPNVDFVHSNFEDYIDNVNASLTKQLSVVEGELRSQETDGWWTLVNTASARIYIKQMNQRNQVALEKVAEPLSAFASSLGYAYPHHLFNYAWKTLMQNHPHDSICGCSVDEVHREMVSRFEKSMAVSEELITESLKYISEKVDTSCFATFGKVSKPFIIYNTTGWDRTGVVEIVIDIERKYTGGLTKSFEEMEALDIENWVLVDSKGSAIPFEAKDLGAGFGYDLPEDRFRKPYIARRLKVTFEAEKVPALGYSSYALVRDNIKSQNRKVNSLVDKKNQMENEYVKVLINADGTLNVTEKLSGHTFEDICYYENVGDIGNEYIFKQAENDTAIVTKGKSADIKLVEDSSYRAAYEITSYLEIPMSADELLQEEMEKLIVVTERMAKRSSKTTELKIVTLVSLEKGSRGIKVKTSFENNAKDHRLRVLFPSKLTSDSHLADSIFEVARRNNKPSKVWVNPSNCQHQQCFVSIDDSKCGLTIANFGLNEYEILRDEKNTIAVTILRSVGELGDWGVFPTPEAQCLGPQSVEFEIITHKGNLISSGAFIEAYQFQVPFVSCQTEVHEGTIPANQSFLEWSGSSLALTGVKQSQETGDLIVRWFNTDVNECNLVVKTTLKADKVYLSNVVEERFAEIDKQKSGACSTNVKKAEILTLSFVQ